MSSPHQKLNEETCKDPSIRKLVEEDEVTGTDKRRKHSVGQDETLHSKAVVTVSTFSPNRQIEGSNNQPQDNNTSLSLAPPPMPELCHKNKSQKLQTLKFDSVPMDSDEYARKGYREGGYVNLNLQSAPNHQALTTTGMRNQLPLAMGSGIQNQQLIRSSMNQQATAMPMRMNNQPSMEEGPTMDPRQVLGSGFNSQLPFAMGSGVQNQQLIRSSMNQQATAMPMRMNNQPSMEGGPTMDPRLVLGSGLNSQLPFAMGSGVQNQQLIRSSMNQQPTTTPVRMNNQPSMEGGPTMDAPLVLGSGFNGQLPFAMGSGVQNQQLIRSSMNQQPTTMPVRMNNQPSMEGGPTMDPRLVLGSGFDSQLPFAMGSGVQNQQLMRSSMNQQPTAMGKDTNQWQLKTIHDLIDQDFLNLRMPFAPSSTTMSHQAINAVIQPNAEAKSTAARQRRVFDHLGAREVPPVCHEDPVPFMPVCCSTETPFELQSRASFSDKLLLQKECVMLWNENNTLRRLLGVSRSQNKILEDRLSEVKIHLEEAESRGKLKYLASKERKEDMRAPAKRMTPSVIEQFKVSPAGQASLSSKGVTDKKSLKRSRLTVNTN